MDIVRNADGTLLVPVQPERKLMSADPNAIGDGDSQRESEPAEATPEQRLLHPGEGGYAAALAEWDMQKNPDHEAVISTANGRLEAMALVHAMAISPDHNVAPVMNTLRDPVASGEALRHVLVGGVHSVEDFSAEVAAAEGGKPLPAHETTRIIGEVLNELD